MKKVLLMALPFLLAGCATAPSQVQLDQADYGTPFTHADDQQVVDYIKSGLIDPYSAHIDVENYYTCYRNKPMWEGGYVFGYCIETVVNAKNSYGAYVGAKPMLYFWRNGQMVRTFDNRA